MRFTVRYHKGSDLVVDHEGQLTRGGLLVRAEAPSGLALYAPVTLAIEYGGRVVELAGQVVQMVAGVGVAVAADPGPLAPLLAAARADGSDGPPAEHFAGDVEPVKETAAAKDRPLETHQRVREADTTAKRQMALKGTKDERSLIMRDTNKALHVFLLQHPGIGNDEILAMARMPGMSADALKGIAAQRKWSGRPEIAAALVRNPSTPVPTAVALVANLKEEDLRQIAKTSGVKLPIVQAIKRRLL